MKRRKWLWPLQLTWMLLQLGWMLLIRPGLWWTSLRQLIVMAPNGWWRKPPHLPVPPKEYMDFRLTTMYGGDYSKIPYAHDTITYLRWCREYNRKYGGVH